MTWWRWGTRLESSGGSAQQMLILIKSSITSPYIVISSDTVISPLSEQQYDSYKTWCYTDLLTFLDVAPVVKKMGTARTANKGSVGQDSCYPMHTLQYEHWTWLMTRLPGWQFLPQHWASLIILHGQWDFLFFFIANNWNSIQNISANKGGT